MPSSSTAQTACHKAASRNGHATSNSKSSGTLIPIATEPSFTDQV
jgi:hypothetical protein